MHPWGSGCRDRKKGRQANQFGFVSLIIQLVHFSKAHLILLGVAIGVALGICAYTFAYAKGWSYMTNNPQACANCHVMNQEYDAWLKSSHRSAAVCNDCHTPPDFIGKYSTKARNGFWHSFYFTTGRYEDNIQITSFSREVVEKACRNCHGEIVGAVEGAHAETPDRRLSCVRCHSSVGHMR